MALNIIYILTVTLAHTTLGPSCGSLAFSSCNSQPRAWFSSPPRCAFGMPGTHFFKAAVLGVSFAGKLVLQRCLRLVPFPWAASAQILSDRLLMAYKNSKLLFHFCAFILYNSTYDPIYLFVGESEFSINLITYSFLLGSGHLLLWQEAKEDSATQPCSERCRPGRQRRQVFM